MKKKFVDPCLSFKAATTEARQSAARFHYSTWQQRPCQPAAECQQGVREVKLGKKIQKYADMLVLSGCNRASRMQDHCSSQLL